MLKKTLEKLWKVRLEKELDDPDIDRKQLESDKSLANYGYREGLDDGEFVGVVKSAGVFLVCLLIGSVVESAYIEHIK